MIQNAHVEIGDHPFGIDRDDGPGRKREHRRDQWRKEEHALVRGIRNDGFLDHELEQIGERLQQPPRPDNVGPRLICTAAQILRSA